MGTSRGKSKPAARTRKDRSVLLENLLSDSSGRGSLTMWRDGVGMALVPVLYGAFPLLSGHADLSGRGGTRVLEGGSARALGLAAIAVGAFIHFHNFWGSHPALERYRAPGEIAAIVAFILSIGYLISGYW